MSIAQLLSKAREMGVTLRLDGDTVMVGGPKAAREEIKPELAAHKPQIIAHLRTAANDVAPGSNECAGALRDADSGAPFLPWGPYINRDQLDAMQRELFAMVDELSKLERWPDDDYDHVVMCIERQPISTLLPDLAYFARRLLGAREEVVARETARRRSWRFDR